MEGLDEPNAEYDQTFVDLEPTTGVPIQVLQIDVQNDRFFNFEFQAKRVMQINVGMVNTTLK